MARKTVTTCDRCRREAHEKHTITIDRKRMDLCRECFDILVSWLGPSNITTQGDRHRPRQFRGPGWVEVCPHHVPCAGPCPTPQWRQA